MTYEDDFVRLKFLSGHRNVPCIALGLDWPPPERIEFMGFGFQRISMSEITDEQRAGMTHVCRGAEYESETNPPDDSIFRTAGRATPRAGRVEKVLTLPVSKSNAVLRAAHMAHRDSCGRFTGRLR